ncbi:MAG TPA: hypothetical protein VG267_12750 [Terracidiphilus sp.]|nr:hypothetical protein [Terracidiphilus sp.]
MAAVVSADTQSGCSNETVSIQVGTVNKIDVMEIFTDGPRAKVEFEYEIIPRNHGEDILENNPIGLTGNGAISVGEEYPHNFSKSSTSGGFSNFGVALFELSDNGWSLKRINMDSTGE